MNKNHEIDLNHVNIAGVKFKLRLNYDAENDHLLLIIGDDTDNMVDIDIDLDDDLYDDLVKKACNGLSHDKRIENIKEQFGLDDDK